jgi:Uma2 family endonuclease
VPTLANRPAPPKSLLPADWNLADLQEHLGGIPLDRIRLNPPPGLATIDDAVRLAERKIAICELVDGVLVAKPMGCYESILAMILGQQLYNHLDNDPRGVVSGESGQLLILPTRMRIPDVSFISWERFPNGRLPDQRVYEVTPDLAVEILSESNTKNEMNKKLDEYFRGGARLVWYIDPDSRTAEIYTARDEVQQIDANGVLDGRDVLPGFQLRLGDLFERAQRGSAPADRSDTDA